MRSGSLVIPLASSPPRPASPPPSAPSLLPYPSRAQPYLKHFCFFPLQSPSSPSVPAPSLCTVKVKSQQSLPSLILILR